MADHTGIEWTDATWNPIVGCSVVSPGCTNCYAMKQAARIERMQPGSHYAGTTQPSKAGAVWTGEMRLAPDHILTQPLRWRRPRRIFVNSMGDLFHESVPDEWIDRVFAVMALCPQHTFQVLTKRSARMRAYSSDPKTPRRIYELACDMVILHRIQVVLILPGMDEWLAPAGPRVYLDKWPLPNVWLGVSAEDQRRADERVPDLLATPAAIRFISAEPLLGLINLRRIRIAPDHHTILDALDGYAIADSIAGSGQERAMLDLVIVGGESGPDARPMHPDWARSLRDQCAAAGTAFFFKQWGEWKDGSDFAPDAMAVTADGRTIAADQATLESADRVAHLINPTMMRRVGKARAGRLLDGIEHNAMPEVRR